VAKLCIQTSCIFFAVSWNNKELWFFFIKNKFILKKRAKSNNVKGEEKGEHLRTEGNHGKGQRKRRRMKGGEGIQARKFS
jgi:hypothetical protein